MAFIVPFLVEELYVLTSSLLDLQIHVICEPLNLLIGSTLESLAQANGELGQCCEHPAYNGVASLALSGMVIQNASE